MLLVWHHRCCVYPALTPWPAPLLTTQRVLLFVWSSSPSRNPDFPSPPLKGCAAGILSPLPWLSGQLQEEAEKGSLSSCQDRKITSACEDIDCDMKISTDIKQGFSLYHRHFCYKWPYLEATETLCHDNLEKSWGRKERLGKPGTSGSSQTAEADSKQTRYTAQQTVLFVCFLGFFCLFIYLVAEIQE